MQRWLWLSGAALGAILCAVWLWTRAPLGRSIDRDSTKLHGDNASTAKSRPSGDTAHRASVPTGGVTHADPEKRAQLRRRLLELRAEHTHDSVRRALGGSSTGPRPARATEDPKLYSAFISQRLRPDLTYQAQTCYEELLGRIPKARGDVTLGLELLADRELGGVVNSLLIREGTTLHEEAFDSCLRDAFSSIYFDPPPSGGRAAVNFRFHFEDGMVTTDELLSLADKRAGRDGTDAATAPKP